MPATIHDSYDDDEHIIKEYIPIVKSKPDHVVERDFVEVNFLVERAESMHSEIRELRNEIERLRKELTDLYDKINTLG